MKAELEELQVKAEAVPLSFSTKSGRWEIKPAPLAYITHLKSAIILFTYWKRRPGKVTNVYNNNLYI